MSSSIIKLCAQEKVSYSYSSRGKQISVVSYKLADGSWDETPHLEIDKVADGSWNVTPLTELGHMLLDLI